MEELQQAIDSKPGVDIVQAGVDILRKRISALRAQVLAGKVDIQVRSTAACWAAYGQLGLPLYSCGVPCTVMGRLHHWTFECIWLAVGPPHMTWCECACPSCVVVVVLV